MALTEPTIVHEGPARVATAQFPKNANVAAMFALATAGLDDTIVRLIADPTIERNMVKLELEGAAGKIKVEVCASMCLPLLPLATLYCF